jgi:two-component system, OmpR family, alkaline phosphatase synthesis response regulator PhoP
MAKKKILVIDDMPNVVTMLKARLETWGYEVIVAFNRRQALASAYAEKPDLILLDIVMPSGGGYSIFTRLRMSPPTRSIPVIFLTGKDRPVDVSRAHQLGTQYYVKKPYKPEALLETIGKVLEPSAPPLQAKKWQKRIMIISEDAENAEFEKIAETGYEVSLMTSIKDGADQAKKEKPDLLLVDGGLIETNHFDGFSQLKMAFALDEIPLMISVTETELARFQEALGQGCRYCLKPIRHIDFLGDIRMALQKGSLPGTRGGRALPG